MNVLFIKLSNGIVMTQHRVDENYSEAEKIASELCENFYQGESFQWAIADNAKVDELISKQEQKTLDDLEISEMEKVPEGHAIFLSQGSKKKPAKKDLVLHCLQ